MEKFFLKNRVKAASLNESDHTVVFCITKQVEDRDGDIIIIDGIKTENFMKNPVVLASHDWRSLPIGKVLEIWKEGDELLARLEFAVDIFETAKTVFNLIKGGYLNAVSIGFSAIKTQWSEDNPDVYEILESELYEVSVVAIPAQQHALVKSLDTEAILRDYRKFLEKMTNALGVERSSNEKETLKKLEEAIKSIAPSDDEEGETPLPTEEEEQETPVPSDTDTEKTIAGFLLKNLDKIIS